MAESFAAPEPSSLCRNVGLIDPAVVGPMVNGSRGPCTWPLAMRRCVLLQRLRRKDREGRDDPWSPRSDH
ncbi:hypothetical protein [Synechococcus sp. KORDI-100]|uniref:hypothetical protein n=1 Tax=Synechococcus sp. KORDI-100 TaxID=1280380 RepID=UPI0012E00697|nr:hypothetical protein [Synechococcus sp. KORDI-100]